MSRLTVAGLLVLMAGCGPFALGAGAAAGLARPAGSGDLSDPTVEIRRNPEPGAPETPPEFVGATSLTLFLDVNKPTVIRLQVLLVIRGSDGVPRLLFGGDAAATAADLDAVLAQCRNPVPDPLTGTDPCAGFFREPPTPLAQATGLSVTLVNEFLTLSGLDDGEYSILVRALDITKQKAAYDHHEFVVDTLPPSPPTILNIAAPAPRQLLIAWQEADDVGSGVASYEVHYHVGGERLPDLRPDGDRGTLYEGEPFDPQGGKLDSPVGVSGASRSLVLGGLSAGRTHYLQVRAVDFAGNKSPLTASGECAASTRIGTDGRFQDAVRFPAGERPDHVRVGDFNGDQIRDLAVMHQGNSQVSVLLGNRRASAPRLGDGTFGTPISLSVLAGLTIVDLEVADVTGDGRSDIVATGMIGKATHIAVVRLSENGTLLERVQDFEVDSDMEPRDLVVGEIDASDGIDALVAGLLTPGGQGTNSARLHSAGSGGVPFGVVGSEVRLLDDKRLGADAVEVGQFNREDPFPDLAFGVGSAVHVDHGTAFGGFPGTTTTPISGRAVDILGADLNGDPWLDLVVTHDNGTFDVLTGAGADGIDHLRFFPPQDHVRIAGTGRSFVTSGFFDSDGILDLAFAVSEPFPDESQPVKVRYGGGSAGRGDATFLTARAFGVRVPADGPADGTAPTSIASADFNADGIADLVVTTPADGHVRVLLGRGARGRGDGTFTPGASIQRTSPLLLEVAADFDGDRILDIAGRDDGFVEKSRGAGSDGIGEGRFVFTGIAGSGVGLAGKKRLIAAEVSGSLPMEFLTTNGATLEVFHTLPNGTFTSNFSLSTRVFAPYEDGMQQPPVLADLDGDRNLDVAIATAAGVSIFKGLPGQRLSEDAVLTLTASRQPEAIVAGDFDGDGNGDLCFLDVAEGVIRFAKGAGSGTDPFAGMNMSGLPTSPTNVDQEIATTTFQTLAAADFDLDGHDDLCVVTARGEVRVLFWRPGLRLENAAGVAPVADGALVTDAGKKALLRTGRDGSLSQIAGGLDAPGAVVADAAEAFAYLIDGQEIKRLDLATGQVASIAQGLGAPAGLALDAGRLLVAGTFTDGAAQTFAGIRAIDLTSLSITELSASGAVAMGDGFAFGMPSGIALLDGDRAVVSDRDRGVVFIVDLGTGDRTVLSGVEIIETPAEDPNDPPVETPTLRGQGPGLVAPHSVVVDGVRALLLDGDALIAVDLATGDRSRHFEAPPLSRAKAISYEAGPNRVLVAIAASPASLRAIDLEPGRMRHVAADGPFALPLELEAALEEAAGTATEGPGVEPGLQGQPAFTAVMVRVADINGDGVPDLLLLSSQRPALAALLGEVDASGQPLGTFSTPVVTLLPVATAAGSMVAGDFNSDGIPDAAVSLQFGQTHRIQVFLGGGVLEGR